MLIIELAMGASIPSCVHHGPSQDLFSLNVGPGKGGRPPCHMGDIMTGIWKIHEKTMETSMQTMKNR